MEFSAQWQKALETMPHVARTSPAAPLPTAPPPHTQRNSLSSYRSYGLWMLISPSAYHDRPVAQCSKPHEVSSFSFIQTFSADLYAAVPKREFQRSATRKQRADGLWTTPILLRSPPWAAASYTNKPTHI
ncbi:unnamed protein product [Pleuronectes platessa]|uniref:Uncharacterized protein n=1 Tax=Pleuronectes platessa TaxID=8262 RepID=A0A9N7V7B3_PLEPL|nr:unnamed protein product [Pleuronectes platessa]